MKVFKKLLIYVALPFMFLFTCFGYAALTDTLNIHGSANIVVPSGLFITEVKLKNTSNATSNSVKFLSYSTTVDSSIRRTSGTGTVTYTVTVFNNTDLTYAYRKLYYQTSLNGYNGNAIMGAENSDIMLNTNRNKIVISTFFPNGNTVAPKESLTFEATYALGRSVQANKNYLTLVNYQFGINVESETVAKNVLADKFTNILNSAETYEKLYNRIDDKFSGAEWTSNYIGNVTDSTSDDSATVNELFAGFLQMTIGNTDTPITVLIKHENIDGNRNTGDDYTAVSGNQSFTGYGCEFTLYMTTSDLSNRNERPPVYAASYTCNRNEDGSCGEWYMIGEIYEGTAQIVGYEGGDYTGSFDTGTWRSYANTYYVSDNYSYSISAGLTIQQVVAIEDQAAVNEVQRLLTETKKILDENIYAGTGMVELEEIYFAYTSASDLYTVNADGSITIKSDVTRAQLLPHIKKLDQVLSYFEGILPTT